MDLSHPKKPGSGGGVRSCSRRAPIYVLGMYWRRWLRRKMTNSSTITAEMIRVGTRVETRPESELEASLGFSGSSCSVTAC